jgi:hypothetical protein
MYVCMYVCMCIYLHMLCTYAGTLTACLTAQRFSQARREVFLSRPPPGELKLALLIIIQNIGSDRPLESDGMSSASRPLRTGAETAEMEASTLTTRGLRGGARRRRGASSLRGSERGVSRTARGRGSKGREENKALEKRPLPRSMLSRSMLSRSMLSRSMLSHRPPSCRPNKR